MVVLIGVLMPLLVEKEIEWSSYMSNTVAVVSESLAEQRVDKVAVELFPQLSRSCISKHIKSQALLVNGAAVKNSARVQCHDRLTLTLASPSDTPLIAEAAPLTVCYQDEHIVVVDKPSGLVVHPGAGNATGTLVHRLLHHFPQLQGVTRYGLVHRIDKDTTGLLMVALDHGGIQRFGGNAAGACGGT